MFRYSVEYWHAWEKELILIWLYCTFTREFGFLSLFICFTRAKKQDTIPLTSNHARWSVRSQHILFVPVFSLPLLFDHQIVEQLAEEEKKRRERTLWAFFNQKIELEEKEWASTSGRADCFSPLLCRDANLIRVDIHWRLLSPLVVSTRFSKASHFVDHICRFLRNTRQRVRRD